MNCPRCDASNPPGWTLEDDCPNERCSYRRPALFRLIWTVAADQVPAPMMPGIARPGFTLMLWIARVFAAFAAVAMTLGLRRIESPVVAVVLGLSAPLWVLNRLRRAHAPASPGALVVPLPTAFLAGLMFSLGLGTQPISMAVLVPAYLLMIANGCLFFVAMHPAIGRRSANAIALVWFAIWHGYGTLLCWNAAFDTAPPRTFETAIIGKGNPAETPALRVRTLPTGDSDDLVGKSIDVPAEIREQAQPRGTLKVSVSPGRFGVEWVRGFQLAPPPPPREKR